MFTLLLPGLLFVALVRTSTLVQPTSIYKNSTTLASRKPLITGCPTHCIRDLENIPFIEWSRIPIATTITAATILYVVNDRTNKTSTTTRFNTDAMNGTYAPPKAINAASTKIATVTRRESDRVVTHTVAYPTTAYGDYSSIYSICGTFSTTIGPKPTCVTAQKCTSMGFLGYLNTRASAYPFPSHPPIPDGVQPDVDMQDDPRGWTYKPVIRRNCTRGSPLRGLFPDLNLWSCEPLNECYDAVVMAAAPKALSTALYLTATSTSTEVGSENEAEPAKKTPSIGGNPSPAPESDDTKYPPAPKEGAVLGQVDSNGDFPSPPIAPLAHQDKPAANAGSSPAQPQNLDFANAILQALNRPPSSPPPQDVTTPPPPNSPPSGASPNPAFQADNHDALNNPLPAIAIDNADQPPGSAQLSPSSPKLLPDPGKGDAPALPSPGLVDENTSTQPNPPLNPSSNNPSINNEPLAGDAVQPNGQRAADITVTLPPIGLTPTTPSVPVENPATPPPSLPIITIPPLASIPPSHPTPPPLLTLGTKTLTPTPNSNHQYILDGQTLTPGAIITVSGTRVSIAEAQTTGKARAPTAPPLLTIGTQILTANPDHQYILDGQTLTPGAVITVSGTRISIAAAQNTDAPLGQGQEIHNSANDDGAADGGGESGSGENSDGGNGDTSNENGGANGSTTTEGSNTTQATFTGAAERAYGRESSALGLLCEGLGFLWLVLFMGVGGDW